MTYYMLSIFRRTVACGIDIPLKKLFAVKRQAQESASYQTTEGCDINKAKNAIRLYRTLAWRTNLFKAAHFLRTKYTTRLLSNQLNWKICTWFDWLPFVMNAPIRPSKNCHIS